MTGNSFGQVFRITTAGESHGPANVVIIDGVPPGIPVTVADFETDMARRRPGQSPIVSQRKEPDVVEILSGVFEEQTTGTSLALLIRNKDQRSQDYDEIKNLYRPGHADYTYHAKYGFRDYRGGGRSSARETVARVAAGVIAKKLLNWEFQGEVIGYVRQVGNLVAEIPEPESVTMESVEQLPDGSPNYIRCPDHDIAPQMIAKIEELRKAGDSIGGIAEIVARNIPAGLGEPVFDKIKADFAKALFSLPAVLGVEYGIGFGCATMRGSENNDIFVAEKHLPQSTPKISTQTNRHGGILGGITSGMPIVLRAAVKPTSSLPIEQQTVDNQGNSVTIRTRGRHDSCLVPRFIPMAEAMVAIVLADHWMRWKVQGKLRKL